MKFKQPFVDELNILALFDLSNTQQGIKIHHDADNEQLSAANRLFKKGLIDQADGGYLTNAGCIAAEHVQALLQLLSTND